MFAIVARALSMGWTQPRGASCMCGKLAGGWECAL